MKAILKTIIHSIPAITLVFMLPGCTSTLLQSDKAPPAIYRLQPHSAATTTSHKLNTESLVLTVTTCAYSHHWTNRPSSGAPAS